VSWRDGADEQAVHLSATRWHRKEQGGGA